MFDIIRKRFLWDAWNRSLDEDFSKDGLFRLKTIQDLAIYDRLKDLKNKNIAEVGGGISRILPIIAKSNNCFNIDKFEGQGAGPKGALEVPGVKNIYSYLGEESGQIPKNYFDVVFSISVVEHVPDAAFKDFLEEGISILKPNGLWMHAIDIYIEDDPSEHWKKRFELYRSWKDHPCLKPIGEIYNGPLQFTCDMASNPDNILFRMGRIVPSLIPLRQKAQSVGIISVFSKIE